jgi:hypothetical protein
LVPSESQGIIGCKTGTPAHDGQAACAELQANKTPTPTPV